MPFLLGEGRYSLSAGTQGVLLEAWDTERNLARRIVREISASSYRLELETLRFGGRSGRLSLVDLDHGKGGAVLQRASRDVLRERLRVMAARQFPGWRVAEVTSGADLEHSLSPAHARGLLVKGDFRWAVLAAPDSDAAESALTYGLIWLDYLRKREGPRAIEGLALFLPHAEIERTRARLACLHRHAVRYRLFRYEPDGHEIAVELEDTGNLDTAVQPAPALSLRDCEALPAWIRQLADVPEADAVPTARMQWSLRVRGLEFASVRNGDVWCGVERPVRVHGPAPVERLAAAVAEVRRPDAPDSAHPWRRALPEAWLESAVRQHLEEIDPTLRKDLVYGQVPNLGGQHRGAIDLLAIGRDGRLCVIELKASEDPALPIQALDYWWRVARHAERGDFERQGYFQGTSMLPVPPRLLLIAPAMSFHPTTETILASFAPSIEVERVGLGVEWQARPRVVMRVRGAGRPEWGPAR